MPFEFVCLGDIILDINIIRKKDMLHGSDTEGDISLFPGGSGSNTAVWLARAGGRTAFIGLIGCDNAGQMLKEQLKREGVTPFLRQEKDVPSGIICIVLDEKGEKSMITQRGANRYLLETDIPQCFSRETTLHISGYVLQDEKGQKAVEKGLDAAEKAGGKKSLDTPSYGIIKQVGPEVYKNIASRCHILFLNKREADVLGDAGLNYEELCPRTVLKQGEDGASMCWEGKRFSVKGLPVKALDTCGAGDLFCALFLIHLKRWKRPEKALEYANRAAAWKVGKRGSQPYPDAHMVSILREVQ